MRQYGVIPLRTYQWEAVEALTVAPRLILGDEVGLGKTYPAIEAAFRVAVGTDAPILVVAPAYLLYQWKTAIETYLGYEGTVHEGTVHVVERKSPPIPADLGGWYLVSYHTFTHAGVKTHPELLTHRFRVAILDEAHRLRGRNSQWTKNIGKLKAGRVFALTGTPIVNNAADLWPLLHLCDPKKFSSYWRFVNEWCLTEQTPWATKILGLKPGLERAFHDMLDDYMLRRRIEDHLPELPPVIEHALSVELPPGVKQQHNQFKKDWFLQHPDFDDPVVATSGGALVTKLRQLTAGVLQAPDGTPLCKPNRRVKIEAVVGLLEDHPHEPVVVFAWFRETAALIADKLTKTGRPTSLCTGDAAPAIRAAAVSAWQDQPNGVIVATISALQEGANLQHARMVVFAEEDYLPASVEQCVARVRRFGQEYPVNCYFVRTKGTVDESVARVRTKRGVQNARALLEDLRGAEPLRRTA